MRDVDGVRLYSKQEIIALLSRAQSKLGENLFNMLPLNMTINDLEKLLNHKNIS